MRNWNRRRRAVLALLVVAALPAGSAVAHTGTRHTEPRIQATPALAPDVLSDAFDAWSENALTALRTREDEAGAEGTPAYFERVERVAAADVLTSPFPSWRGLAAPASRFGSAFAGELGSRVAWAFRITGPRRAKVDVADGFSMELASSPLLLGGVMRGPYTHYRLDLRGIDYGPDRRPGGGDDVTITAGAGPVDEIVGFPSVGRSAGSLVTPEIEQQQVLDAARDELMGHGRFTLTVQYTFGAVTKASSVQVVRGERDAGGDDDAD
jgi:hypothetical protein